MDPILIALLAVIVTAGAAVVLTRRRPPALPAEVATIREDLRAVAEAVAAQSVALSRRLEGIDSRMTETQTASIEMARGIYATLGDLKASTASVAEQAKQFTSLQDLLRAPKARGGLGEAMLEEMLRQVLPPSGFSTQHRFASGTIVDAVVRAGGRLICIDSKFPLANYQRICDSSDDVSRAEAERAFAADVERHIRDISSRYIVPDEGTLDFAVMYVPAEGVYGEVLRLSHRKNPLFETAMDARVVPMSPLTMYGYLQTILFGLKCLQIEKSAEAILGFCGQLQQDVTRFAEEYDTLGKHLGNARNKYEQGAQRLDRFRDRLDRAADLADGDLPEIPVLEAVEDQRVS
jgi:DNA recombination protein RmuC